jgi:O-antigen ligase
MLLAGNGVGVAGFALIQRILNAKKIFWFYDSPNGEFFGSFIYKNHAGAYLVLMLAMSSGLSAWYYLRGQRRLEKSNPAGLFVFFSALVAMSILVSYARGATLVMVAFLTVAIVVFVIYQVRNPDLLKRPVVMVVLVIGFGFFLRTSYEALSMGEAWHKIDRLFKPNDASVEARLLASRATWDMFQEHPWYGNGAGSFRYLFPAYQQRYPKILTEEGKRLYWEHAHNDVLEFPAELGICGVAIMAFCFGYWLLRLIRCFFWENPLVLLMLAGLILLMAHGWTDFIFQNPAVLLTWCAIWPAITLWGEYEELNLRG